MGGAITMKNIISALLTVALLSFFLVAAIAAEKNTETAIPLCPVTGKATNKNVSIDYHGAKLYFSNVDSEKKFKEDVEKYAAKANLQLVVTGQARQTACPLMGKPVVSGKSVVVSGVKVDLCCNICMKKITKANPKEQIEMVFGKGFDKGYTVKKT
jgi:YHS domain-containing protein